MTSFLLLNVLAFFASIQVPLSLEPGMDFEAVKKVLKDHEAFTRRSGPITSIVLPAQRTELVFDEGWKLERVWVFDRYGKLVLDVRKQRQPLPDQSLGWYVP
jgi:hypothetical protein